MPVTGSWERVSGAVNNILGGLDSVSAIPEKLLRFLIASTVCVALAAAVYVVRRGYIRPAWTHRSIDVPSIVEHQLDRIARAVVCLKSVVNKESVLAKSLRERYPWTVALAGMGGKLEGDRRSLAKALLNPDSANWITRMLRECRSAPPVTPILREAATEIRRGSMPDEQRAACSIADIRLCQVELEHLIAIVHARNKKMGVIETVHFFLESDINDYVRLARKTFDVGRRETTIAEREAERFFERLKSSAAFLITGSTEPFIGKLAKSIVKPIEGIFKRIIKPFVNATKIVVAFVKAAAKIVGVSTKVVEAVFTILTQFVGDIVKALRLVLVGLRRFLKELDRGLLNAAVFAFRVCLGTSVYVAVSVFHAQIKFVITAWHLWTRPILHLVFISCIFAVVSVAKIALGILDSVTNGGVRFLATTEVHPCDWWRQPASERSNVHERSLLSWRPCFGPYVPSQSGLACIRCERGVPMFSPQSIVAMHYYGQTPLLSTRRVSREPRALRIYARVTRLAMRMLGNEARDFTTSLVLCRQVMMRDAASREAAQNIAKMGIDDEPVAEHQTVEIGTYIMICAMLSALGTARVAMALV